MRTVLVTLLLVAVATAGAEKARKLLDQGKVDAAVKAARSLVEKNAKDVDGWLVLADALVAQSEPEEAWTELEKAIEIVPTDGRLDLKLADVYVTLALKEQQGSKDGTTIRNFYLDAETMYGDALKKNPKLVAALYGTAFVHFSLMNVEEGRKQKARKALADCLALDKAYAKAHALQALIFYGEQKYDVARDKYEVALKLDQSDPVNYLRLGHCYALLKQTDKAKEWYIAALKEHPGYIAAIGSGLNYLAGKTWAKRLPYFKDAVTAAPKSYAAWFYYGYALTRQERWEDALAAFQKASQLTPDNAQYLYYIGLSYESTGEPGKALDFYRKALKVAPNYGEAAGRFQMIAFSGRQRDFARMEKLSEELLKLAPEAGYLMNNYALVLRDWSQAAGATRPTPPTQALRRIRRSSEVYEMAAKILPDDPQIQSDTGLLFEFYPAIRDDKKAEAYFLRSLELSDFTYRDAWSGMRRLCMRTKNYVLLKDCAEGVLGALEDSGKVPIAPAGGSAPGPSPNDKPMMIGQAKAAIAAAIRAGVKDDD